MEASSRDLFAGLDEAQAEAVRAIRGPVAILAGAGSGKTRTITHRLAYAIQSGVVDPNRILAVTFTTKAAGEMRTRLAELGYPGLNARTFHSAALRQLMFFWPTMIGSKFPEIISNKAPLIGEIIRENELGLTPNRSTIRDLSGEIEWAKVQELTQSEYQERALAEGRLNSDQSEVEKYGRAYALYESLKLAESKLDFEDILILTAGMLEEERSVRERIRDQYRYFTVDEYQDISPLSQKLLNLWLGNREEICVVGDPAQTIYSFTGATSFYLRGFTERYPNATVVELGKSYRSTPEILATANKVLAGGVGKYNSNLTTDNSNGHEPITYPAKSEGDEISFVVNKIKELQAQGIRLIDIAVLARTNAQLETLEVELDRNQIDNDGVGSLGKSGEKFFDRQDVKEAMRDIRQASVLSEKSEQWQEELRGILRPYENSDFLKTFLHLAGELHQAGVRDLRGFLRELEERSANNNPPLFPGVHLASLHAAKGLEWPIVFIIGASDAYLPYQRPWASFEAQLSEKYIEEERRLLYVGLTRAQNQLYLSYTGLPSRFIATI
jgi:DNA helicase-2/ATP-dependent DNA helicase PcrA